MSSSAADPIAALEHLMVAARRGDWNSVAELTLKLGSPDLHPVPADFEQYIKSLKEALIVAKASRADLLLTSQRIAAASGFHPPRE